MAYKKGEETRNLILSESKKIFLDLGYKKTTYKILGEHLNINQNLISYYFSGKGRLAQYILEDFFNAEDIFIKNHCANTQSPMVFYAMHNRIHYRIFAENEKILTFYSEVIAENLLNDIYCNIDSAKKLYHAFFDYYNAELIYPYSYYMHMEVASETQIMKYFTPDLAYDEQFLRFVLSVFPKFIGIKDEEIISAVEQSKILCQNISTKEFSF